MFDFAPALWNYQSPALVGAAAGWTPASLPGLNIWATADAAYSFTDLGTTNVSADGQSVEQVNDRSGHGFNLTQSGVSGSRPTWFSNSGKPYWQFTAANSQNVESANGLNLVDASGQSYIALAISFDSVTVGQLAVALENTTAATRMLAMGNTAGAVAWLKSYKSDGTSTDETGNAVTAGSPCVLIGTVTTSSAEVWVNNVSSGGSALSGSREVSTGHLVLGESIVTGSPVGGKIFGIVQGTGILSSTDRANLQTYMAGLHP